MISRSFRARLAGTAVTLLALSACGYGDHYGCYGCGK